MNKNKALLVIIIAVIIVLLGLAIFYFFFQRESAPYQPPETPGDVLFPIGPNATTSPGGDTIGSTSNPSYDYYNQPQTFQKEKQRLRLISSLPVSGATLFERNAETFIRFVERADGHIYEAPASKDESPYRISNTTIPKIYEAYWVNDGQGVIIRYLKNNEVQTFYARIRASAATSSEQELVDGTFLQNGISAVVISPETDRIFYIADSPEGSVGIRSNPNGTQKTQLFSSPATEWLPTWEKNRSSFLFTKPSSEASGFLYALNTNNSALERVLGGIHGLTALSSPSGDLILLSRVVGGGLTLTLFDNKTQTYSAVGKNTLPEKCVWSKTDSVVLYCAVPDYLPSGNYPDVWYQGIVSFADNLWKINTETGATNRILAPQSVANTTMDITNLVLSAKEDYLLFA